MKTRCIAPLAAGIGAAALGCWLLGPDCSETPAARAPVADGGPEPEREAAAGPVAGRQELPAPQAPPEPFEAHFERLVEVGVRVHAAAEEGDLELAQRLSEEGRAAVAALWRDWPDADERALFVLTGLLEEDTTPPGRVRRRVSCHLLAEGLAGRLHRESQSRVRRRLDQLVSAMLASVPQSEPLAAELGGELLADRPYVGLAHENAIGDLAVLAERETWLRPVATALLLTLWHNLQRSGARNEGEITSLALLFKDDRNPVRRRAALQVLLAAQNGRFREAVLADLTSSKDRELARELAHAAAQALDAVSATGVLERLQPLLGEHAIGAFMAVGARDARPLREAYERKLAAGVDAALRAELISGASFDGTPEGIELARVAFEQDDDLEVRARALLALTARAPAALGERALDQALDDPRFADDPRRLGLVVLALENLARGGDVNAVQRIAQRLRHRPSLTAGDRGSLEAIVQRHVPR